jgi:hypothetical protein
MEAVHLVEDRQFERRVDVALLSSGRGVGDRDASPDDIDAAILPG